MAELKSIKFPGLTDTYEVVTEAEVTTAVNSALATAKANGDFKGDKGSTGNDGKTPVKGIDYWTEADKSEIVAETVAALPKYEGLTS